MTKKKKSGYDYLKERVAELENENVTLAGQLHSARDMWSNANAKKLEYEADLKVTRASLNEHIEHYHWLYKHAPFLLKWWYCKHFFGK